MAYVLKLIRSLMSFSLFHWPHLRWRRWTRRKVPWKLPTFSPVTWISITGPNRERSLASEEDERDFNPGPHCQGLIHVGNYSFHYQLQTWSQVAEAIITLSVSWAHGVHPQYQHLWSWAGIFFVVVPIPKYLSPSAPKHIASESPIWTHALENPESTYIEWKVVMLLMGIKAKNTQEKYGSYFKKQKNLFPVTWIPTLSVTK